MAHLNSELCWLVLPLTALLSQIGGTWQKAFRRYGIPIAMVITYVLFAGWNWWLIPMALFQFGVYTLPVTLKGDSIKGNGWINWAWLPVKYILVACPPLFLQPELWFGSVLLGLLMATMVILSNMEGTAKYFQWKMIEAFHGMTPVIILCLAITT
jgi:hypothetical protein